MRLSIFVTHPVQYHVPLWRALAQRDALDVRVHYFSDHSVRGGLDAGFGRAVAWDVDLLSGYRHDFESRNADLARPGSVVLSRPLELLRRERPDAVLLSGYTHRFEQQLALATLTQRIPLLMRGEFSDFSFGPRPLWKYAGRQLYLRAFYATVSQFCFPGEAGRRHLAAHGVAPERTHFSPYAVDDSLIAHSRASTSRGEARRALNIPDSNFVFILSGKLIPRKAPMAALDAIATLSSRARVHLIVLGDGELRDEVVARGRALLGDRFIFPGFVNQTQLAPYFAASDCLVMPSLHETWGLVVNEAMHYGLPCIVSDQVGSHLDLVLPGQTGLVYPLARPAELAAQMGQLVENPSLARGMGARAEQHIAQYTIERAADGVMRALSRAIAMKRRNLATQ